MVRAPGRIFVGASDQTLWSHIPDMVMLLDTSNMLTLVTPQAPIYIYTQVETPAFKPQSDEPPPSPWGPKRQHKHRDPIVWLKVQKTRWIPNTMFCRILHCRILMPLVSWAPTPNKAVEGFRLESRETTVVLVICPLVRLHVCMGNKKTEKDALFGLPP